MTEARSESFSGLGVAMLVAVFGILAVLVLEFGTVTGRKRRCGWFDAAALKRSIQINGVSGLCVTKLDVLDGVERYDVAAGRFDPVPPLHDARALSGAALDGAGRVVVMGGVGELGSIGDVIATAELYRRWNQFMNIRD